MVYRRSAVRIYVGLIVVLVLLDWHVLQGADQGYRPIKVPEGGSVRGTVRLSGSIPGIAVPTGKDDKICGRSVVLSNLQTGRNGGVINAIVYLQRIDEGKPFAKGKKYLLDQKDCRYHPHVTVLPFGSQLEIVNSDPVLHNVHLSELGSSRMSVVNIAQPIKGQRSLIQASQIKKPGIYVATCDAGHPWMNAYIVVAEHPYYAVTDVDGSYSLDDIPPGQYKLTMWHEGVRVAKVDTDRGKTVRYEYEEPYLTESQIIVAKGRSARVDFQLQLR